MIVTSSVIANYQPSANELGPKGLMIKKIKLEGLENGCEDTFITTMGKLLR